MKIAIIGTRGIPAKYGGFETFTEEIAMRFVAEGHQTVVYGRSDYYRQKEQKKYYKGVKTIFLPSLKIRQIETISNSWLAFFHLLFNENDTKGVVLCNCANFMIVPLLKILRKKILINVDGLEWKRQKWGYWGRLFFKFAEFMTVFFGKNSIVVDSKALGAYYSQTYKIKTTYIPYGTYVLNASAPHGQEILNKYGLNREGYFLQITRFVPDNNVINIMQGFRQLTTDKKLMLVGWDNYQTAYLNQIIQLARQDPRIILPGFIYDQKTINCLLVHSFAYLHGNEVGGTNPALLQAMGAGTRIAALNTVFNREVLADAGMYFEKDIENINCRLSLLLQCTPEKTHHTRTIVERKYNWDKVARNYLECLTRSSTDSFFESSS